MERLDEHEMLVEFSEMTAFDFSSEEFQKVRKDYIECRDFVSKISWVISSVLNKFRPLSNC